MAELTKDYMYKFRSTIRSKDSKGRDVLKVYLNTEEVNQMIADLTAAQANPKGAVIVIHTEKKEFEGRKFDSSFGFVKQTQDNGRGGGGGGAPTKFQPKADTAAVAASIRSQKVS